MLNGVMDKLLPCPFCGEGARIEGRDYWVDCDIKSTRYFSVGCNTDGCFGEISGDQYYESTDEATKAWNTRVATWPLRQTGNPRQVGQYLVEHYTHFDSFTSKPIRKVLSWDGV